MRRIALAAIVVAVGLTPVVAQQTSPNMQNEADKGIKTQNSGASGYVGEQDRPGSAAQMPAAARVAPILRRRHQALKIREQELPEHRVAQAAPLLKVLSVRTRRPSNRTHRISKVCRETRAARPPSVDGSLLEGAWRNRHAP